MKKTCTQYIMCIVMLSLFCFLETKAQTIPEIAANNRSFSQIFDSLSTGLIPSRIPHGILMDRVYGWAGLEEWNNGDTVKAIRLFQTWFDAEGAYMNPANRPSNYFAMRDTVDQMIYEVKLPILAFSYQFGFIDSLALQDGRLSVSNGILTDNNNGSPYFSKQVNIAGLATEDVFQNKPYLLYFDPSVVFNNTGANFQSISVLNLTTNSQFVLTANNGVAIQFASSGVNTLRFTIQHSNGSSYTTHQRINVKPGSTNNDIALRPVGPNCTPVSQLLTSTIPFQGYSETIATNSHADVHYYFHTISPTSNDCERVLRKPIIIVEGFDPQNGRSFDSLYRGSLIYFKNGVFTRLGDELRDKGYDVIVLNFPTMGSIITNERGDPVLTIPNRVNVNGTTATTRLSRDGGADYIERNAMLLVKLIQDVNTKLAANGSNEKIVVVGPSMGGLVSRYALSYMEKQQSLGVANMNHNCRVWVSFDSPHDGANISTGVQNSIHFLGYTTDDQGTRDIYEKKLKSTAAQQQMIQQSGNTNSISPVHTTFYNNIKNNGLAGSQGFPQNVRKVNLLNGNGKAINTYSPGELVLSGEAYSRVLGIDIKGFDIEINFSRLVTNPGQYQQTSYNFFINKKRWFAVSQWSGINNTEIRGCMDAVQGSVNNEALPMLYDSLRLNPKLIKLIQHWYVKDKKEFCFIPTISALGFKQPVSNWHTRVDDRNLLCNNEINFDSYYLAPTNEKHIFLTEANVNWVMQEIEKGQPGCPVICSYSLTGGVSTLCVNNTSTYSLDVPAPTTTTVQWIVSNNLQVISSTNNSITVKAIGAGNGSITSKIVNLCGSDVVIKREISLVVLTMQANYNSPTNSAEPAIPSSRTSINWNDACIGSVTTVTTSLPPGSSISWSGIPSSPNINWYQSGNNVVFSFTDELQTISLAATVSNNCGNKSFTYNFRSANGTNCGSYYRVNMSPNPAASSLGIALDVPAMNQLGINNPALLQITEINIYDKLGVLKKRIQYPLGTRNITVPVSDLSNDVYTVRVTNGVHHVLKQLIIQR